jgi:hypothetical protein
VPWRIFSSGPRKVIAPDHSRHLPWAQALCPQALGMAQHDGNLGQRLNDLDRRLRNLGLRRLLYIGSDCPALQPSDYRRVACLLEANDRVLLGARDGGVVLMASNRPWPDLGALPWSIERLGTALFDCCRRAGHSVAWADELFDIDHKEDVSSGRLEAVAVGERSVCASTPWIPGAGCRANVSRFERFRQRPALRAGLHGAEQGHSEWHQIVEQHVRDGQFSSSPERFTLVDQVENAAYHKGYLHRAPYQITR